MLLLASAQAEAVPASVKNKIVAYHQRRCTGDNGQLCKYFDDFVDFKRMKHRSFDKANLDEFPKVKSFHERKVRSIDHKVTNDIITFTRYDNTKTVRNVSLSVGFRDNAISNGESTSLENISQTTLPTSDIKPSVQKDSSDKVYLQFHVNGETM